MLQREDGSFVGTAEITPDGSNPQYNMVAFNSSGNVLWTVANETPQIATAGGGVIGKSGNTYDQNGNVIGQSQDPGGVPNWMGQFYNIVGLAIQQRYSWVSYGAGFWSAAGANPSTSATSVPNLG